MIGIKHDTSLIFIVFDKNFPKNTQLTILQNKT